MYIHQAPTVHPLFEMPSRKETLQQMKVYLDSLIILLNMTGMGIGISKTVKGWHHVSAGIGACGVIMSVLVSPFFFQSPENVIFETVELVPNAVGIHLPRLSSIYARHLICPEENSQAQSRVHVGCNCCRITAHDNCHVGRYQASTPLSFGIG